MRYVIIRDDDINALTPEHCLERLYRPFLDRGMPVNLATIPEVDVNTRTPAGAPEGFLFNRNGCTENKIAIGSNEKLVRYLRDNDGYHIIQHGCHHDPHEFDRADQTEVSARIERGTQKLLEAGFAKPQTFVAPHDKLSRTSLLEVATRFRVLSTGWFELRRLPISWWPSYALKKARKSDHWRVGRTWLLTHPGCFLSYHRPQHEILDMINRWIEAHSLTVLVTHWWEYFRDGKPDEPFIEILHETSVYLAAQRDVKVISFDELAQDEPACL